MKALVTSGALAMAMAAALSGCTAALDLSGREWGKADADIRQVTLDEIECVRGVSDAGRTPDLWVGGVVDVARFTVREGVRASTYSACMRDRGYQRQATGDAPSS
jgi:outer membrane lipoprotein SlyB